MSDKPMESNICKECGVEDGEHHPDCSHFDSEKFARDLTDVIMALHASLFGKKAKDITNE
jgi:hypothetical protein